MGNAQRRNKNDVIATLTAIVKVDVPFPSRNVGFKTISPLKPILLLRAFLELLEDLLRIISRNYLWTSGTFLNFATIVIFV
jgi:hypothetical protein